MTTPACAIGCGPIPDACPKIKTPACMPENKNPSACAGVFTHTLLLLETQTLQLVKRRRYKRPTQQTKMSALVAITIVRTCAARRGIRCRRASYERQASRRSATDWSRSCRLYDRTCAPPPACTARVRRDRWPSRRSRKARPTARSPSMRKALTSSSIVPRRFWGRGLHNRFVTGMPAILCVAQSRLKTLE
jgi:hypothetical protein